MHFALRVGGMAACSAGGSTATFKKYATIEALQKPVQSTNSSWRKRIHAFCGMGKHLAAILRYPWGDGRLIDRRQHGNP